MLTFIDRRRAQRTRRIAEEYSSTIQESSLTRTRQVIQAQNGRNEMHNDLDDSINDTGEDYS
jgi:hypothetical protein